MLYVTNCWGLEFAPFANIYPMDQLPTIFHDLRVNKARLTRTNIDQHKLQTQNSTTLTSLTIFDSIHPVTIRQLHTMVKNSKPSSTHRIPYQRLICSNVLMTFCQRSPISLTVQYCLVNFRLI